MREQDRMLGIARGSGCEDSGVGGEGEREGSSIKIGCDRLRDKMGDLCESNRCRRGVRGESLGVAVGSQTRVGPAA
jgi:hypothetical protein